MSEVMKRKIRKESIDELYIKILVAGARNRKIGPKIDRFLYFLGKCK